MASKRQAIANALVAVFQEIDGTSNYLSDISNNVYSKLIFWDEVNDHPTISVVTGQETRQYEPGDFKWGFLTINIRVYVNAEDPKTELENIFSDLEDKIDANNNLIIDSNTECTDIRLISISDDEGLLAPDGVGEMILSIRYTI
jgi:hypothetical protein